MTDEYLLWRFFTKSSFFEKDLDATATVSIEFKLLLYYIWEMAFAFFDAPHAAATTILVLAALGLIAGIKFTILDKRTHYQ